MPVIREVLVFDDATVKSWEAKYQGLPGKIEALKSEISTSQNKITVLQPQIDSLDEKISKLTREISQIDEDLRRIQAQEEARLNASHLQVQHGNTQPNHHGSGHARHGHGVHPQNSNTNTVATFFNVVGSIASAARDTQNSSQLSSSRDTLDRQRSNLESQRSPLRREVSHLEDVISKDRNTVRDLESQSIELYRLFTTGNAFLFNIASSPETLFNQINSLLKDIFIEYSNSFPAGQSRLIRKRLRDIPKKIEFLSGHSWNHSFAPTYLEEKKSQYQYFVLCGLLWDLLNQTDDKEKKFSEALMKVLRETHVAEDGDLPDKAAFNTTCKANYQEFVAVNSNHEQMQDLTDDELDELEKHEYTQALEELNRTINQTGEPLATKAKEVVKNIELMKEKEKDFDIVLYTKIFKAQDNLIKNPSLKNILAYKYLADHAKGASSLSKKVVGSMLGLLGVAILVSGVLATVATFGAAPLAFFGIALATTVAAKVLSIMFASIGFASLITGIGLLASGVRKGVSKNMVQLTDTYTAKKKNVKVNGKSEADEEGILLEDYEDKSYLNAALMN